MPLPYFCSLGYLYLKVFQFFVFSLGKKPLQFKKIRNLFLFSIIFQFDVNIVSVFHSMIPLSMSKNYLISLLLSLQFLFNIQTLRELI